MSADNTLSEAVDHLKQRLAAAEAHGDMIALVNASAIRTVLSALTAGEPVAWLAMESAPKDGTEVETFCVHPTAHYSSDAFGEGWAAIVLAKWTNHNGGGWTWLGLCGTHMAWRPISATPPDKLKIAIEALEKARAALHHHYVEWDGEPEDAVPLQLARAECDAALSALKGEGA